MSTWLVVLTVASFPALAVLAAALYHTGVWFGRRSAKRNLQEIRVPNVLIEWETDGSKRVTAIHSDLLPKVTVELLLKLVNDGLRFATRLHLPPGTRLAEWLKLVFGKRVYRDLLEQHLADYQEEWQEAHAAGRTGVARWIRVRCWIVLLWSVLGALPIEKVRALLMGETGSAKRKKGAED